MKQDGPIDYDDWIAYVEALKRERWARILASEPPGRPAGRRPRDPEQEALLAKYDKQRYERFRRELS
ncbi:MAG: hypothetical protein R3F34_19865 [Planctomycetota bacterium]